MTDQNAKRLSDIRKTALVHSKIWGVDIEFLFELVAKQEEEINKSEMRRMHLSSELYSAVASMEGCHRMAEEGVSSLKEAHRNALFQAKRVLACSLEIGST